MPPSSSLHQPPSVHTVEHRPSQASATLSHTLSSAYLIQPLPGRRSIELKSALRYARLYNYVVVSTSVLFGSTITCVPCYQVTSLPHMSKMLRVVMASDQEIVVPVRGARAQRVRRAMVCGARCSRGWCALRRSRCCRWPPPTSSSECPK